MDNQREAWAPGSGAAVDCGMRARDWLRLDRHAPAVLEQTQDALTSAQLRAWAERLRGAPAPDPPRPAAAAAAHPPAGIEPEPAQPREHGIPASALVPVGRGAAGKPTEPAAPPLRLVPSAREVELPRWRLRLRRGPRSPAMRLVLLCLAAFFLAAGVAHSFARWKPARIIVVPATEDARSVIT